MRNNKTLNWISRAVIVAGALLLTSGPVHPGGGNCMSEMEENDPLFNDLWHGGDAGPPDYHDDCDNEPGPDECDWLTETETADREYSQYHSSWQQGGITDHGHTWMSNCTGGN
jgi:hypothetical protein